MTNMTATDYDYVVIGSGAGGGPLAANLAKAGFKVLLLEAGGDPCSENETGRLMYEVPIFHGLSTEYKPCAWDFFVRHYTDDEQQAKDKKKVCVDGEDRIWYPRAGALGGCTAHNAMITVVPQDSDWNRIADDTGDESWRAERMRPYFARLENCGYVSRPGTLGYFARGLLAAVFGLFRGDKNFADFSLGHGFAGWLPTSQAKPEMVLQDGELFKLVINAARSALSAHIGNPLQRLATHFDPNDRRNASGIGVAFTPFAAARGKRAGPREYLLRVKESKKYGDNLTIKKHALATRVLFEGTRAIGVEYIDRAHVYRADPQAVAETPDPASQPRAKVYARREVILSGGAFNTPQLLMLSGVGSADALHKLGIKVVVNLPGVGANLQDRYEVCVVAEFVRNFVLLEGASFAPPADGQDLDKYLLDWERDGTGIYATNGAPIGIIKRSRDDLHDPDLYILGMPGYFKGYQPGYSKFFESTHNKFTWAIVKARTRNTGCVQLATANPWDRPLINFQYFDDGKRTDDADLKAVIKGIEFVRLMNERMKQRYQMIKREEIPGDDIQSEEQLGEFIRNEAWGHHASCTCKIGGDDDELAVLDSRFRVRGTQGLRVVDASVFPKIPGYFIVAAIYMISEKAFDVIVEDARKDTRSVVAPESGEAAG
jgi:choline dehydrogenase